MKRSKILVFILLLAILLSVLVINVSAHGIYVVNKSTNKYHLPDCSYLPSASNSYTIYRDDIDNYPNLSPCGHCRPDIYHSYEPANPGQSDSSSSSVTTKDEHELEASDKERRDYDAVKDTFSSIFATGVVISIALFAIFAFITFLEDRFQISDVISDISIHLINAAGIIFGLSIAIFIIGGIVLFFMKIFA